MAIEEEFSIEIPDKDADNIHSSTFNPPCRLTCTCCAFVMTADLARHMLAGNSEGRVGLTDNS